MIYKDEYVRIYHYVPDLLGDQNFIGYYFVEMNRHFDGIQNAEKVELTAMILVTKKLARH